MEVKYPQYEVETQNYNSNKVKTKKYEKNGVSYHILNYDRDTVCFDDTNLGLYRSVIVSNPENKILCFSPPKSIPIDVFTKKYPANENNNKIIANEIIEGTMINLFYDHRIQKWEIATKSGIGGNYFFYRVEYSVNNDKTKQSTFYRMFLDALSASEEQELNDLMILENISKNYCYSFVLQHPTNHIVLKIKKPKAYLVGVYEIKDSSNRVIQIPQTVYETWNDFHGIVDFPKRYEMTNYEDMETKYCSIQQSFTQLGVMFTNIETGERTSMKNPTYEEIKLLRGNNPNLQYQYLCLRKINKVKEFLKYFPQYKTVFYNFYDEYNQFITNIHLSYLTYYVQKQEVKISKKFFPHIYKIHHELYLPSLQTETPLIIRRRVVQEYFDAMEPRSILYYLNYDSRKLESMKSEVSNSTSSE